MDPDANLRAVRRLIRNLELQVESGNGLVDLYDASELIDTFRSLDEWMSKGGFLPVAWQSTS